MSRSKVYYPPTKRQRRLDLRVVAKLDKYMSRKPYPPGQHGQSRHAKPSDYALQLLEKQKAKFIYGLRERQFRNLFKIAQKSKGSTGEKLLQLLESRIDNVVFRGGFSRTRRQARQLVSHRHFLVNGKIVDIPSYKLKKGDTVTPAKKTGFKINQVEPVSWLSVDKKNLKLKLNKIPARDEIPYDFNEQLIVEYYSR